MHFGQTPRIPACVAFISFVKCCSYSQSLKTIQNVSLPKTKNVRKMVFEPLWLCNTIIMRNCWVELLKTPIFQPSPNCDLCAIAKEECLFSHLLRAILIDKVLNRTHPNRPLVQLKAIIGQLALATEFIACLYEVQRWGLSSPSKLQNQPKD